jgi:ribosomal protein S27AE
VLFGNQKCVRIVKECVARVDVTVTVIGIGIDELILEYRKVTQDTCPHDAKVKMAGYKDRYECTRCHKIIPYVLSDNKMVIA